MNITCIALQTSENPFYLNIVTKYYVIYQVSSVSFLMPTDYVSFNTSVLV